VVGLPTSYTTPESGGPEFSVRVYFLRWVGYTTPNPPPHDIIVVAHISSGFSSRASPARVTLPGAYAPAAITPNFLGTGSLPSRKGGAPLRGLKELHLNNMHLS
jgi:hypothetical protein